MEGLEPAGALRTFMSEEPAITARTRSYDAAWAIVRELARLPAIKIAVLRFAFLNNDTRINCDAGSLLRAKPGALPRVRLKEHYEPRFGPLDA